MNNVYGLQFIDLFDYLLLPFYLLLIFAIARAIRNRYYPEGHLWRPYFFPGLIVKLIGGITIGLIYQYYYKVGDTILFYVQTKMIYNLFWEDPWKALNIIFQVPKYYQYGYYEHTSKMLFYGIPANFTVISVAGLISIVSFGKYLIISVLFATISFSGFWALFRVFAKQYPAYLKQVAVSTLFIPSTILWGSGIFKDTICMFGIGWITYNIFTLFIQRKIKLFELVLGIISALLISVIKIYILIALIPALCMWVLFHFASKSKFRFMATVYRVLLLAIVAVSFFAFNTAYKDELGGYSLENLTETAKNTAYYISKTSSDESSTYDLGITEFTPLGIAKAIPAALNVALFRPYLWESRKIFVFFNAIEASLYLAFTILVLVRLGPLNLWNALTKDPNLQFCLIFTLLFALSVGLTSANFGALSRYRIPFLPFFALFLFICYSKYKPRAEISMRT